MSSDFKPDVLFSQYNALNDKTLQRTVYCKSAILKQSELSKREYAYVLF